MRRTTLVLVALGCWAGPARTSTVVVPDDHASIQAAIDSAADTVLVRYGNYDEHLQFARSLVLRGLPDSTTADTLPTIGRMTVGYSTWPPTTALDCSIERLAFRDTVLARSSESLASSVRFLGCRLAEPLWCSSIMKLTITDCAFRANVGVGLRADIGNSTFDGARLFIGGGARVHDNTFRDVPDTAIFILADGTDSHVFRNRIDGARAGVVRDPAFSRGVNVYDNVIMNCAGIGISTRGNVVRNTVRDCGGDGIVTSPMYGRKDSCAFNRVERVANGIQAGSMGWVHGNTVLEARGIGLQGGNMVIGNVVGRCGGHGIYNSFGPQPMRGNTVFGNSGSGIVTCCDVTHNISFGNALWGAQTLPGGWELRLECNDFYANGLGATSWGTIGATDLEVDPRFCDVNADSVWLRSDSPLLDAPGCGRIGALGEGCTDGTGTRDPGGSRDPAVAPHLALSPVTPNPTAGRARIAYSIPAEGPVRLCVFDVSGREVARLVDGVQQAGAHVATWTGSARAGVYFVRLRAEDAERSERVLIAR